MNKKMFTIGFTKKNAETFFTLLKDNQIKKVIDIRLNNKSQLAGFAKYPDIEYFLKKICNIDYIHDTTFSPAEETLKKFKSKQIDWEGYQKEFNQTMNERNIINHIKNNYITDDYLCLLCSEAEPKECHRNIIANKFNDVFNHTGITHL